MTNEEFIKSVSLEGEIWKDVVGYEGKYWISSLGRIFSCNQRWNNKYRIINAYTDNLGYKKVGLCSNSIKKNHWVHRIVATSFIPNPYNRSEIDHIDGNPSNNRVENLRWSTRSENMMNPITRLRHKSMKGIPNTKLYKKVVLLPLNNENPTFFESAKSTLHCGYNPRNVAQVCNGVKKSHKGRKFMWASDYESLINKSKNALPNPS